MRRYKAYLKVCEREEEREGGVAGEEGRKKRKEKWMTRIRR